MKRAIAKSIRVAVLAGITAGFVYSASAATIEDANQLENQGNWQGALQVYQELYQANSKDYNVVLNMARLTAWQGDFKKSETLYREAKTLASSNEEQMWADLGLGEVLGWQGKYDEAKVAYKPWMSGDNAEPRYRLGQLEQWQGHMTRARELYEENLKQYPSHVPTRLALASVFAETGRYKKAFEIYNDLMKVENDNPQVWIGMAKAQMWRGDLLAADKTITEAKGRFAGNAAVEDINDLVSGYLNHYPYIPRDVKALFKPKNNNPVHPKFTLERLHTFHTEAGNVDEKLIYLKSPTTLTYYPNPKTQLMAGLETGLFESGGNVDSHQRYTPIVGAAYAWNKRFWTGGNVSVPIFSNDGPTTLLGRGTIDMRPTDWWQPSLQYRREMIDESLLSATGLRPITGPFAGNIVGRDIYNEFALQNNFRLPWEFRGMLRGALGYVEHQQIDNNFFYKIDYNLRHDLFNVIMPQWTQKWYAGYEGSHWHYDEDRLGHGGAYLQGQPFGNDGITTVPTAAFSGTGGYFSPDHYLFQALRLGQRGDVSKGRFIYDLSAFAGIQDISRFGTDFAWGAHAVGELKITKTFSALMGAYYSNANPFDQYTFYGGLRKHF